MLPLVTQDAAMGALPTLRAATDPDVAGGQYYGPSGMGGTRGYPEAVASSPKSHDTAIQQRLWAVSEQLTRHLPRLTLRRGIRGTRPTDRTGTACASSFSAPPAWWAREYWKPACARRRSPRCSPSAAPPPGAPTPNSASSTTRTSHFSRPGPAGRLRRLLLLPGHLRRRHERGRLPHRLLRLPARRRRGGHAPDAAFCHVTGAGTDSTGKTRMMWARVKGETENACWN